MPRENDDIDSEQMGDTAGRISEIIDLGEIAANAARVAVPPVVKAIGKGAGIVAEAAQDPSSSGNAEKFICTAASEIVKSGLYPN